MTEANVPGQAGGIDLGAFPQRNQPLEELFQRLTGHAPFPWQKALYNRFVQGDIPARCEIPTGLGKTAVVALWLIALAHAPQRLPRRLVYVVNRRTVVDQTTHEAARRQTLAKGF